jgi:hypothetical protein
MMTFGTIVGRRNSASTAELGNVAVHIEVGHDWTRCDGREGCGALLPITQASCPLCGRVNRQDVLPLAQRRLVPGHDAYDHAVSVLLPARGALPPRSGLTAATTAHPATSPREPVTNPALDQPAFDQ